MSALHKTGLLAVDVGNSQVKLGWFAPETACPSEPKPVGLPIARPQLPQPEEMLAVSHVGVSDEEFDAGVVNWLEQLPVQDLHCALASVHPSAAKRVNDLLEQKTSGKSHLLTSAELPLEVRVDEPAKVGIDRLLSVVAANWLREKDRPAIVVCMGTACTVNLVAADGAFEGGAILPGMAMSSAALHQGTSALPWLSCEVIQLSLDAVGKSTQAAISSGLVWGMVGAIRELIDRMTQPLDKPPQVFLTGGEAAHLAEKLTGPDGPALHIPNMVLAGIRIAAGE